MRYLLGAGFFVIAFALLASARAYRARLRERFDAPTCARMRAEAREAPRSLATIGPAAQPFVMFALFYVALRTTLAFVEHDGASTLSWFDLVGFHALLAGYGTWFTVRAAYSLPQSVIDRELERSLDEHIRGRRGARRRERRVAQLGPPGVERRRR